MVWFNDQGKVAAVIMTACGNPMGGDNTTPSYSCQLLKVEKSTDQNNTYSFTTVAPTTNGATISRVVYDFGDGTAPETRTNLDEAVTHTYIQGGDFTAKVTVYAKLPGGKEVIVNGGGCAKRIQIEKVKPAVQANFECTQLTATPRNESDDNNDGMSYTFRATGSTDNAKLTKADFDFGDGQTSNGVLVAGSSSNAINADHTYAQAGTYIAKATLFFQPQAGATTTTASNQDTSDTCRVTVTIQQKAVVTTASQPTLPNTGPAGAVGMFTGASVLGTLGYRWRTRRRMTKIDDLVNKLRG
jgi:hypothetical protein